MSSSRLVHFVSLGCPKNRVDSEIMVGHLDQEGYALTDDPAEAELIVVNTCAFLESSKQESVEAILDQARFKDEGACRKLVVTGCLSQRYPGELQELLPEVDHFIGTSEYTHIAELVSGDGPLVQVSEPRYVHDRDTPKLVSTAGRGYAYLKVAEGCSRRCTFCIIPTLRGDQQISRPVDDVVAEAQQLAAAGVRELNLVAQDLTAYGRDLGGGAPRLEALLQALGEVQGIAWVRCLYAYPENFPESLIATLRDGPRIARYLDMPLQHISDRVLRAMRRGHGGDRVRKLVGRIRELAPELTLRTTFIVGFPGETDAEFQELCDFVSEMQFHRVGVFRYSREEGTDAFELGEQVPTAVKTERYQRLMEIQQEISQRRWSQWVGREVDLLVEGPSAEHEYLFQGRVESQAPDIDGVVYLSDVAGARAGELARARITEAGEYDLVGEVIGPAEIDDPVVDLASMLSARR